MKCCKMNNESNACRLTIFEPQKEPRTVTLSVNEISEDTQILDEYGCPVIEYTILYVEDETKNHEIQTYISNWAKNNPISEKKARNLEKLKRLRELRKKKKEKNKARKVKKRIIETIFDRTTDLKEAKEEREILEAMKVKNVSIKKILNIKSNKSIDLNTNFNPAVNNKIVLDSTPKGVEYVVLDDSSDDDTNIQLNIDGDYVDNVNDDADHSNREHFDNPNFIISSPLESPEVVLVDDSDSEIECVSVKSEIEVLSDSSDSDVPSKRKRLDESSSAETTEESPKKEKPVGLLEEFVQDSLNVPPSGWQQRRLYKKAKHISFSATPFEGVDETSVQNFNYDSERNNLHIRLSSSLSVPESNEHDIFNNEEADEEPNYPVETQIPNENIPSFQHQSQDVEPKYFENNGENFLQRKQFPRKRFLGRGRFQNNRFPAQNVEEPAQTVQPRQPLRGRGRLQNNRSAPQNMKTNSEHVQPNRKFSGRGGFQMNRFRAQSMDENIEHVQPRRNFTNPSKFQNNSFPAQNLEENSQCFPTQNTSSRRRFPNNRGFVHNVQQFQGMEEGNVEHLQRMPNAKRFINSRGARRVQNARFSSNRYEPPEEDSSQQEGYQPENDMFDDQAYTNQEGFNNYQQPRQRFQKFKPNQKIQNSQQHQAPNFSSLLHPPYLQLQKQLNQSSVNKEFQAPQNLPNKLPRFCVKQQNEQNLFYQNQNAPARFSQPNQFQPKRLPPPQIHLSNNRFQSSQDNIIRKSNNLSQIPNKFQYRANINNFQNPKFNNRKQDHKDQRIQNDVQDYESLVMKNLQTDQNIVNDDGFVWENPEGVNFVPVGVDNPIEPPWSTTPAESQYRSISRRSWINQHYT